MATKLDDGSWEVQGKHLTFPVRIGDAGAACAAYPVRAARAATLLEGTGLEPVALAGWALAVVGLVDYRVNDLGTYDELALALPVLFRGRIGVHITQLPVTETFTMEAGRALWGLPKWLGRAELEIGGSRATGHLAHEGEHVLTAALSTLPFALPGVLPGAVTAFAPRGGVMLASPVRARLRGIRVGAAAGTLVLGSGHPMADELRSLGLPRRPLLTAIVDHLAFDMEAAEELPI
ncbi:acetoacetate decarboxylase family protein [Pseudonocardia lutea]|jgi:hypothetical protein|uniref:Acetoacetate decarboxylase family protein n=1 Tax=Pseudonocardia lutea TaxID=2172015 RepID=A0ABW1I971_9PSEU